jgi:hypothetical protein
VKARSVSAYGADREGLSATRNNFAFGENHNGGDIMVRIGLRCPAIVFALLALAVSSAQAQGYKYVSIDYPNAIRTRTWGINSRGVIVGDYLDSSRLSHGFLLVRGRYVTMDVPGSLIGLPGVLPTGLRGINPAGDIVGIFITPPGSSEGCTLAGSPPCIKGFLLHRGTFSTVLFPGHEGSIPKGITPDGAIYGCYHDADFMATMFGFARTASGEFTSIAVPASMNNGATPDGSTIIGLYSDLTMMPPITHGYVIQQGNFQSFDVPGSTFTQPWDINPRGRIVGEFQDLTGAFHGFLRTDDGYTSIDFPSAIGTHAGGINRRGAIVGQYTDTKNVTHGFLAVPAEDD